MARTTRPATLDAMETETPGRSGVLGVLRSGIDRMAGSTLLAAAIEGDQVGRAWRWMVLAAIFASGAWAWASGLLPDILALQEDILYLLNQHIGMVVISGGLAIAIGIPLGIWLSRPYMRRYAESLMQILNIGTTIPTLAILALSMSVLGIGTTPAIFGLFVATLLPIVRNAYAGCQSVPPHLIESATGMGMTPLQILRRVEVPNALFVIFAGVRTALAINVGTVPLAFLIGGGGLGELIFQGIALNDFGMMLAGAIPTALLAILVDFLLAQCQYWLIPRGVNPLR
ncbi:ABC transporter permease [Jannaschia donghaensis]|uniref:Glycine betaine/carnitine/choline transport system permease protein OpuCB n=1 Tax=Jannaschia donghaensis TaxID=420998 RepID=A0A0M6YKZ3_9RHOB|nr:ABC transporter permease [Jannaschia donghaensis]CTQ50499.1 Glycine betaine/carnitine/choline transport system permease protein OpuCB [Jannaschia donghaensis]